jgi:hypothetical protein
MRTFFEKCASWKTPEIPSKMRTFFQDAHQKLRIFERRLETEENRAPNGGLREKPGSVTAFGPARKPRLALQQRRTQSTGISRFGTICYPLPCFATAMILRILNQTFELKRRTDASD